MKSYAELIEQVKEIYAEEVITQLPDLDIRRAKLGCGVDIRFTGLDDLLEEHLLKQYVPLWLHQPKKAQQAVLNALKASATRQRQRRGLSNSQVLSDQPLTRLLARRGYSPGELTACIAKANVYMRGKSRPENGQIFELAKILKNAPAGVKVQVASGIIHGSFELSPQVKWRGNHIVARRTHLPLIVQEASLGRPVTDLVDHPDFEGMTIDQLVQSTGNRPALAIYVKGQRYYPA